MLLKRSFCLAFVVLWLTTIGIFSLKAYKVKNIVSAAFKNNKSSSIIPSTVDAKATVVVYSKDRPMQLYAFLESLYRYVKGDYEVVIVYAASDKNFLHGYKIVEKKFCSKITWREQACSSLFKPLTLEAIYETAGDFVLFAVDDIVVTDFIDLVDAIKTLESEKAYVFRFTLGKNINYCYTQNRVSPPPLLAHVHGRVYSWWANTGNTDWLYPHSLDMALYRKQAIREAFHSLSYHNPNLLEARWAFLYPKKQYKCLCFESSKAVNVPLNRVQTLNNNRHMKLYTAQELLDLFFKGYKIHIEPLRGIKNNSPHMEYAPTFVNY